VGFTLKITWTSGANACNFQGKSSEKDPKNNKCVNSLQALMHKTHDITMQTGPEIIRHYLATLPKTSGVYRMLDSNGKILYVGKAKNLASRVAYYTQEDKLPLRLRVMVSRTASMEFITTNTESEALLLEANLIRHWKPSYNILLRDDKSFPYILITEEEGFAQIVKHRGAKTRKGTYFGPFASAQDVNEAITTLQKIFQLRPCTDAFFASRKRPCLQYQIKRCSGPCVGKISLPDYQEAVRQARDFLTGKSALVQQRLSSLMEAASNEMDYEKAAAFRDRIKALTHIQAKQHINISTLTDTDIIAAIIENGQCCIQIFFFRNGLNYGNKSYFPLHTEDATPEEALSAFITQFYPTQPPPPVICLSHEIADKAALEEALTTLAQVKVQLQTPKSGDKKRAIELALDNAREALARKTTASAKQQQVLAEVANLFSLPSPPERIEVFDNSHITGKYAVGAMIVAGQEGFIKNSYRRFSITAPAEGATLTGGDDYAMLREVLTRRYSRLKKTAPDYMPGIWPDLIMIDGGAGHLSTALPVMKELGLEHIPLVCIAKGVDRNAGREQFHQENKPVFTLDKDQPVMRYLQILRDEAHRFAIGSHRIKRAKSIRQSTLDDIPGIGATRKKALLNHFGSVEDIKNATLADLMKAPSINSKVAEKVYGFFHG
jgi:excinuclease ABC subunit C